MTDCVLVKVIPCAQKTRSWLRKPSSFCSQFTVVFCSFIFMLVKLMQHIKRNIATVARRQTRNFPFFLFSSARAFHTHTQQHKYTVYAMNSLHISTFSLIFGFVLMLLFYLCYHCNLKCFSHTHTHYRILHLCRISFLLHLAFLSRPRTCAWQL